MAPEDTEPELLEAEYLPDGVINVPGDIRPAAPPRLSKSVGWIALGGLLLAIASNYRGVTGDLLFASGAIAIGWGALLIWSYGRDLR